MKNLSKNQKGFSAIEIVLVLFVIVLIAAAGYVVHKNHKPTVPHKTTSVTKPVASPPVKTPTPSSSPSPGLTTTFKISQLGIEIINVPPSIQDLTDYLAYSGTASNGAAETSMFFSTDSLTALDSHCSANNGGIGALTRTNGTFTSSETDGDSFIKQFSGFWIAYAHPQAACSTNEQTQKIASSQTEVFSKLVTNPDNLQAIN